MVPITLLLVSAVVFGLSHLSGNLVDVLLGQEGTPAQRAALIKELHLDEPLPLQYVRFVGSAVRGDFGRSYFHQRPALDVVAQRLPATIELALAAMVIAVVLGLALGITAALREGNPVDVGISSLAVLGQSLPPYWLGIMLILLFSVQLRWLPTSGRGELEQLLMPSFTAAAFVSPQIILLTRSSMLEVLHQPYLTTALAKGLTSRVIILRHALRNALTTVIPAGGVQLGNLIGGLVITETVFSWPGIGRLSVEAIFQRDLPVIEASVLVLAASVMIINIGVDILTTIADPRIRTD